MQPPTPPYALDFPTDLTGMAAAPRVEVVASCTPAPQQTSTLLWGQFDSPLGAVLLLAATISGEALPPGRLPPLAALHWLDQPSTGRLGRAPTAPEILEREARRWPRYALQQAPAHLQPWARQLFSTLAVAPGPFPILLHGTPFQLRVWRQVLGIPSGETRTYSQLAQSLGLKPQSSRAVGVAVGANPLAWLVPCHRVGRSDGGLGGYRWGLARKRALLAWEQQHLPQAGGLFG